MRTWMLFGVGVSVFLGVACGSSDGDDPEGTAGESSGGESGSNGGAAPGGEGGSAATPSGAGASGEGGEGGGAGPDPVDCTGAETLPAAITEDVGVGPGCVRIERTTVSGGAALTIAPGTRVLMAADGYLDIEDSGLVSVGTADAPIVFTSESSSPQAGDWQCVHVDDGSANTEIRYTTFEYGGTGCAATGADYEATLTLFAAARAVSNNTFRHSASHAVKFASGASVRSFENNAFEDNALPSILVAAPELLALGEGLTFADPDEVIEIDTTFALSRAGTWLAQPVPFLSVGKLNIDGGVEVTIAAGTEIRFNGQSFEVFDANLIVAGTEAEPVVFTSSQATPAAGDWGCLLFTAPAGTPRFDHAVFEYGGNGAGCTGGSYRTGLVVPAATVIRDSTFRWIDGSAIRTSGDCNTADWCANTFDSVLEGPLACDAPSVLTACP